MLFSAGESDISEIVTTLVFQLAVILVLAKLGGEVFTRYLRLPAVIGELLVGVAIGPFALGDLIDLGTIIPGSDLGRLFEKPAVLTEAISLSFFSISQLAVVVLLFVVGLETNLGQFFKYVKPGSLIALGGVLLPFFFGVYATILFGFADSISDPEALFMGAVITATSIGVTARVLGERGKLNTSEGVTIIAAAVIDDVLGILILTVAVGVADRGEVVCCGCPGRRLEGRGLFGCLVWRGSAGLQIHISVCPLPASRGGRRGCVSRPGLSLLWAGGKLWAGLHNRGLCNRLGPI